MFLYPTNIENKIISHTNTIPTKKITEIYKVSNIPPPMSSIEYNTTILNPSPEILGDTDKDIDLIVEKDLDLNIIVYQTIYLESRSECIIGQYAVLCVIRNRANIHNLSYSKVCKKRYWFSCWNKRRSFKTDISDFCANFNSGLEKGIKLTPEQIRICEESTYYHNPKEVTPRYYKSKKCIKLGTIGNHVFYKLI